MAKNCVVDQRWLFCVFISHCKDPHQKKNSTFANTRTYTRTYTRTQKLMSTFIRHIGRNTRNRLHKRQYTNTQKPSTQKDKQKNTQSVSSLTHSTYEHVYSPENWQKGKNSYTATVKIYTLSGPKPVVHWQSPQNCSYIAPTAMCL